MVLNSGRLPILPYPYLKREGGPDDGIRHGKEILAKKSLLPRGSFRQNANKQKKQQAVWLEAHMLIYGRKMLVAF